MENENTKPKKNRYHKISFRLNELEYQKFLDKQIASNSKLSDFIRQAVISSNVIAKMTEEERMHLRMLIGISTNLNQLAHKANAQIEFVNLAIDVQKTRREIDEIIFKINSNGL